MPDAVPSFRIISIGTLEAHPLWGEREPVRTGHATTTLISSGEQRMIVNPSLPAQALAARLSERTPVPVDAITHVFLTSFAPDHRRGLGMFDQPATTWLIHEPEREAARQWLTQARLEAEKIGDGQLISHFERDLALLDRCRNAPDSVLAGVDLFPLPGVTAGTCGLIIAMPGHTVLIAGDAVATGEHLQERKVLPECANLEQAQESFREAVEIADLLVPGRDNLLINSMRGRSM